MVKTLLVTIAIGKQYLQMYNELFRKSQEIYAKRHSYDFLVITDYLDKKNEKNMLVHFNKILVCSQTWSDDYDFIVFIDADILIHPNAPPIHNCVDYGDNIGIADEYSQPTCDRRIQLQKKMGWEYCATDYYKKCHFDINTNMVFNSGVLVLQPKKHKTFLEYVYNKYAIQSLSNSRGPHFEQTSIGYELQKAGNYIILPNAFNAIWGLVKLDNKDNITLENFYSKNHFIHFAGYVDYDKVRDLYLSTNM